MRTRVRRLVAETAFYLGLAALFTHELDAMTHHEWRLLPLLNHLRDDVGRVTFVALHVPLFAAIIAWIASTRPRVRSLGRLVVSAFLVVHAGLHLLFTGHPDYTFHSALSYSLIFGGAICGAVYLGMRFRRPTA